MFCFPCYQNYPKWNYAEMDVAVASGQTIDGSMFFSIPDPSSRQSICMYCVEATVTPPVNWFSEMLTETWVCWFYTTISHTEQIKTLYWNTKMDAPALSTSICICKFSSVHVMINFVVNSVYRFSDFHHMLYFGSMFAPHFEFHRHLITFQGQLQSLRELIIFYLSVCVWMCFPFSY